MRDVEKQDDAVDRLHEAIKLYLVKVSKAEMIGRGKPALSRDPDLHDEPRAYRRHHRQEPDGTRRQEDQEPLRLLTRGPRGNPLLPRADHGQHATCPTTFSRPATWRWRAGCSRKKPRCAPPSSRPPDSHFARLREGRPESIETSSIHLDIIRDLKRINGHLTSVAYPILELTGELHDSRLRERNVEPVIATEKPATSSRA